MAPLVSRVLVALVGVPLVLLIVSAGGWWLFALAGVAAILALHEYALMIRSLRPVILAAYTGALLSLLGAHLGGLEWTVVGFLGTMVLRVPVALDRYDAAVRNCRDRFDGPRRGLGRPLPCTSVAPAPDSERRESSRRSRSCWRCGPATSARSSRAG